MNPHPHGSIQLGALVLAAAALITTGCASTSGKASDAATGSNRPAETAAATVPPAAPPVSTAPTRAPSPTKTDDGIIKFGETFTYEDGLSVTIAAPVAFKPSQYAAVGAGATAYGSFNITIVNKTAEKYEPSSFYATVQSGNVEGSQVFDSAKGYTGAPSTSILPGREATFKIGFGLADAADVVLEARPGFAYEEVVFTS